MGTKKEAASFIGRQLLHLNLEPYFTFTLWVAPRLLPVPWAMCGRHVSFFYVFSGSFFYTYTNLFPSYCFSDDGTAEQPQECLTTFPVIISFAFLLRLIIYFISVEVQPSAIPDSRLLI